jgi:tripartite-type tricarboxylate transporter receptor subunit TctC
MRIMVGASPGGGTDILARLLAEKFAADFKQTVVVENRPGASNTIAAEVTARAPADGATLLLATNTGQAIAPHLLKLKFDPLKDLQPVGLVAVMPNVLVVSATSPTSRSRTWWPPWPPAGELKYASSGIGSTQHIAGEAFALATRGKATHVPYKGSSQAHVDVISGEVTMMFDSTSSAMGQIRPASSARWPSPPTSARPNCPTCPRWPSRASATPTCRPGTACTSPPARPRPAVDKLVAELQRVLKLADVQARIKGLGGEVGAITWTSSPR